MKLKKALGFRDVVLFYFASGLSIRWIATAAATGPSAITVWVLAWFGFFLPLAACVLELSSRYPQEGGLYIWTREACGEWAGFMAAWAYWTSNLPYFSAVLYFAASSLLFALPAGQHLAQTNLYFLLFTAGMITLITLLNTVGLGTGKWLNNVGAVGSIVPALCLLVLATVCLARDGSATRFTLPSLVPRMHIADLIFWSTIFFAFAGCECLSFMGDEIKDARRVVPPALVLSGVLITIAYIAGTAAMLVALPAQKIAGLSGFMTVVAYLCQRLGVAGLVTPIALLVAIGGVGAAAAYLSSSARLPFVVGIDHYLPAVFARVHSRWATPYVALLVYGVAGVLFGLLSQAGTSVQSAYNLLVAMSVITYFIPYLFVFVSMIRLQGRPAPPGTLRLPGGRPVAVGLACIGFFSTAAAILLSVFPAEDEKHPAFAISKIVVMTAVLLLSGWLVYHRGQRSIKRRAALAPAIASGGGATG